jgi:L-aminopeptidase/D-esterase-like protein
VSVLGSAPGTRETDLLNPINLVNKVHAIVLAGGSAFGLDAASGVMRYLEEKGIGYKVGTARVPIVPAAILFDLGLGKTSRRPDANMGYQAASSAGSGMVEEGNVGAGAGATVGKIFGMAGAMKSGLGTACLDIGSGILVGAITAVNAFGDVIDPQTNQIIAGARQLKIGPVKSGSGQFADTMKVLQTFTGRAVMKLSTSGNTVISVIATNARLDKAKATKVAQMAHDGLARVIRPAHTMLDGDTVFVMATGVKAADVSLVGAFAAEVLAQAILNAVRSASPAANLPSATSLK